MYAGAANGAAPPPPPETPTAPLQLLQTTFAQFVQAAEVKLNTFVYERAEQDVDISGALQPGADAAFDRLLVRLGSTAKHCPKLVVDCVMVWRKAKSDTSDAGVAAVVQAALQPEGVRAARLASQAASQTFMAPAFFADAAGAVARTLAAAAPSPAAQLHAAREAEVMLKERKSLVANFVLCRALTEILQHLRPDTLPGDLGSKLEEMIFAQLKAADPELLSRYPNRQANLDFFAIVVGQLSKIRFASVSDRFVKELSPARSVLKESKVAMLIWCMRFLELKIYPLDALEETADFLQILAEFFKGAPSHAAAKVLYAELFVDLLEPIAAVAVAEVNMPVWKEAVETLYAIASKMLAKGRHLSAALAVNTVLLCVSRRDFFHQRFGPLVDTLGKHLRDSRQRPLALACLVRLLWVYLFRNPEHPGSVAQRRVEGVLELLVPPLVRPKGAGGLAAGALLFSNETGLEHMTFAVWHIACKHRDLGAATIRGLCGATAGADMEPIVVERAIVGLRVLLLFLRDVEEIVSRDSLLGSGQGAPRASAALGAADGLTFAESKWEIAQPRFPSSVAAQNVRDLADARQRVASLARPGDAGDDDADVPGSGRRERINAPLSATLRHRLGALVRGVLDNVNNKLAMIVLRADLLVGGQLYSAARFPAETVDGKESAGAALASLLTGKSLTDETAPTRQRMGPRRSSLAALASAHAAGGDGNEAGGFGTLGGSVGAGSDAGSNSTSLGTSSKSSALHLLEPGKSLVGLGSGGGTVSGTGTSGAGSDAGPTAAGAIGVATPVSVTSFTLSAATASQLAPRERHLLVELLRTWVEALPRVVPAGLGPNKILELLSRYTLHADAGVRAASVDALRRIASVHDAENAAWWGDGGPSAGADSTGRLVSQRVAHTYVSTALRVLNDKTFDWATNAFAGDSSKVRSGYETSAAGVFELYLSLVRIWSEQWQKHVAAGIPVPTAAAFDVASEMEAKGVLALCSHSSAVRRLGVDLLRRAREVHRLAQARGVPMPRPSTREARKSIRRSLARMPQHRSLVVTVLEERGGDLLARHRPDAWVPAVAEGRDVLLQVATRDDASLWFRVLPDALHLVADYAAPRVTTSVLTDLVTRVLYLYPFVLAAGELPARLAHSVLAGSWSATLPAPASPAGAATGEALLAQAAAYLAAICALATPPPGLRIAPSPPPVQPALRRLGLGGRAELGADVPKDPALVLQNPRLLFALMLPLLACERPSVRFASVAALGGLHRSLKPFLLHELLGLMQLLGDEDLGGSGMFAGGQTGASLVAAARPADRLRTELTHLLALTLCDKDDDDAVAATANSFTGAVGIYLRDLGRALATHEPATWEHQLLRVYFCRLVEQYYVRVSESAGKATVAPVAELWTQLFQLLESWCGHGAAGERHRLRASRATAALLDTLQNPSERAAVALALEEHRRSLELAALRGLAALCRAPLRQGSAKALFQWIDAVLAGPDEAAHAIVQRALEHVLEWNAVVERRLVRDVVHLCFVGHAASPGTRCYFGALVRTVSQLAQLVTQGAAAHTPAVLAVPPADLAAAVAAASGALVTNAGAAAPALPLATPAAREFADGLLFFVGRHAALLTLALFKLHDASGEVRRGAHTLLRALESVAALPAAIVLMPTTTLLPPSLAQITLARASAVPAEPPEALAYEAFAAKSGLPVVYEAAAPVVAARLAAENPQLSLAMVCEGVKALDIVSHGVSPSGVVRQQLAGLLQSLAPWLQNINLALLHNERLAAVPGASTGDAFASQASSLPLSSVVLGNLLVATAAHADAFGDLVADLWASLTGGTPPSEHAAAAQALLTFLLDTALQLRNPAAVHVAKKVLVMLGRTVWSPALLAALLRHVTPKAFVPTGAPAPARAPGLAILPRGDSIAATGAAPTRAGGPSASHILYNNQLLYMAHVGAALPELPQRPPFSPGQLACMFLVDVVAELGGGALLRHVPLLLHVTIIQLDHFLTVVCEQSRQLLVHLVGSLLGDAERAPGVSARLAALLAEVPERGGRRLWAYEDIAPRARELESVEQMAALVDDLLDALDARVPDLDQRWGAVALRWGTSCPVRHLACRSLQLFRILLPHPSRAMLADLAHRLSNTLADPSDEIQGFALEALDTLAVAFDGLPPDAPERHPQLFWVCVACLLSPHDWEVREGLLLAEKFLDWLIGPTGSTAPVGAPVLWALVHALPARWAAEEPFAGVMPLLVRALRFSSTVAPAVTVATRLLAARRPGESVEQDAQDAWDTLIDSTPLGVFHAALATLPTLHDALKDPLSALEAAPADGEPQADAPPGHHVHQQSTLVAAALLDLASAAHATKFVRFFQSYLRGRLAFRDELLKQFANVVQLELFPVHALAIVAELLLLSSTTHPPLRRIVLTLLRALLPQLSPQGMAELGRNPAVAPALADLLVRDDAGDQGDDTAADDAAGALNLDVVDALLDLAPAAELADASVGSVLRGQSIHRLALDNAAASLAAAARDSATARAAAAARASMDAVASALYRDAPLAALQPPVHGGDSRRRGSAASIASSASSTSSPLFDHGAPVPPVRQRRLQSLGEAPPINHSAASSIAVATPAPPTGTVRSDASGPAFDVLDAYYATSSAAPAPDDAVDPWTRWCARVLARPDAAVSVGIAFLRKFSDTRTDPDFGAWLQKDVAKTLGADASVVARTELEPNPAGAQATPADAARAAAAPRTLARVVFAGAPSAALALAGALVRCAAENNDAFYTGVVTWNADRSSVPQVGVSLSNLVFAAPEDLGGLAQLVQTAGGPLRPAVDGPLQVVAVARELVALAAAPCVRRIAAAERADALCAKLATVAARFAVTPQLAGRLFRAAERLAALGDDPAAASLCDHLSGARAALAATSQLFSAWYSAARSRSESAPLSRGLELLAALGRDAIVLESVAIGPLLELDPADAAERDALLDLVQGLGS